MTTPGDALTVREVAALLRVNPKHVRKLIASGRLVATPIGFGSVKAHRRVTRAEVARFLAAGDESTRPAPPRPVRRGGKLPPVPQYV